MDEEERRMERMEEEERELAETRRLTNKHNRRVIEENTVFYKIWRIKPHNSLCFFHLKNCLTFSMYEKTTVC